MRKKPEYFSYRCPHCKEERNALDVALELDQKVLRVASARRNAQLQTPHAGPGRPKLARCPGCSMEMPTAELRDHRMPCVRQEIETLRGLPLQLAPKDPDPYPNFYVHYIRDAEVDFKKASNHDIVTVDLRKIAEIAKTEEGASIRVLGRVVWHDDRKRWRFAPTAPLGRPPQQTTGVRV